MPAASDQPDQTISSGSPVVQDYTVQPHIEQLGDRRRKVRSNAALNLGLLVQTGKNADAELDTGKAETIKKAVEPAIPSLLMLLEDTNDKTFRRFFPYIRWLFPFVKQLEDDFYYKVRENAAFALGEIGNTDVVPTLIKALVEDQALLADGSDEWYVQIAILDALGKLADPRSVEPLLRLLGNKNGSIRAHVVSALGAICDGRAIEPLVSRLVDEDAWVRMRAAVALHLMGDQRSVEPLIKAIAGKERYNPTIRAYIAECLGDIGDVRAVEPLIRELQKTHPDATPAVARALGKLGDPRAIEPLTVLLKDCDKTVHEAAMEALKALS